MNFVVCSYGGCGSWILLQYFSRFGRVSHCHSRCPPLNLTSVVDEHFTRDEVSPEELASTRVVYLFRDPKKAMASAGRRWAWEDHLRNIESAEGDETFGLDEFHENYVSAANRNYRILCVKYETLWGNWSTLNAALCLPDVARFYPRRIESTETEMKKDAWNVLALKIKTSDAMFFAPTNKSVAQALRRRP